MLANVDWPHFGSLLAQPASVSALVLSLGTSSLATLLCVLLGVPVAALLARLRFPGQRVLRALVLLPLVLPPVVGGIALLYTYGRRGLLGPALGAAGIELGFSTAAVVLAQTFVAIPFLILSVEGALRTAGSRYEAVAATLGARPSRVLLRVTLPVIAPALVSGTILSFARALGEFGATITFAGSLPGTTQTLPLALYFQLQTDPAAAVALSLLLVAVSVLIVGVAYLRRGRMRVL
ncbi:MAG: molybdate ABC transporter permease subunit [Micrococcales bacterium]|nr:molybdate ABC transporter permease subunit [Micrococcales bacterium]